jgi:hypothetical protein
MSLYFYTIFDDNQTQVVTTSRLLNIFFYMRKWSFSDLFDRTFTNPRRNTQVVSEFRLKCFINTTQTN